MTVKGGISRNLKIIDLIVLARWKHCDKPGSDANDTHGITEKKIMSKLQQLENVIHACGGKLAGVHGYVNQKGVKTNSAQIRMGGGYITRCHETLREISALNPVEIAAAYGVTVEQAEIELSKKVNSLRRSISGDQPERTDTRETVARSSSDRRVVTLNKDGTAIQIHGYKYSDPKRDPSTTGPDDRTGLQRLQDRLNASTGNRAYSLSAFCPLNKPGTHERKRKHGPTQYGANFDRFTFGGLTITPADIPGMISDFRLSKTA